MIRNWARYLTTEVRYQQPNAHGRSIVMSVLNSTVTKREAKDYLNKYTSDINENYCLMFLRHLSEQSVKSLTAFCQTISRIETLGLRPILVLDPACPDLSYQSQRLDDLLHAKGMKSIIVADPVTVTNRDSIEINVPLLNPHIIPIVKPYCYQETEASKCLAKETAPFLTSLVKRLPVSVDKVFMISKLGGLPSIERHTNSHVFVNLSQEYQDLKKTYQAQLRKQYEAQADKKEDDLMKSLTLYLNRDKMLNVNEQLRCHMDDLHIMNDTLNVLPHTSTGLITTYSAAAKVSDNNPLVYNILTDRSLISSSLPRFKRSTLNRSRSWYELPSSNEEEVTQANDSVLVTTVFKKGIDIHVFDHRTLNPDNSIGLPNSDNKNSKDNDGTKLNLYKLKGIIDASFKRSLDLSDYLKRINGNIASIIVIGDYEGIAILTFEGPKDNQFVYLDKFGVTPKLKGSLGISDIIFNLMFQKFPKELIWRSREDNVVNKWYFQRSTGVLHLSLNLGKQDQKNSIFKLFYYGDPEIESFHNVDRLRDYAKYVRDIVPSWKT